MAEEGDDGKTLDSGRVLGTKAPTPRKPTVPDEKPGGKADLDKSVLDQQQRKTVSMQSRSRPSKSSKSSKSSKRSKSAKSPRSSKALASHEKTSTEEKPEKTGSSLVSKTAGDLVSPFAKREGACPDFDMSPNFVSCSNQCKEILYSEAHVTSDEGRFHTLHERNRQLHSLVLRQRRQASRHIL